MDKDQLIFLHADNQELKPVNSTLVSIKNLDNYEDNTLTNTTIQDICDFFEVDKVPSLIDSIYKKLSEGSSLHVQGSDLKQLGIAIAFNKLPYDVIKKVLYSNKKSIHTMGDMINILKSCDFKITEKRYTNIFEYYIKAYK
jgi:hypothetical protein